MLRMDDYNLSAKVYWWITAILGAAVLALAVRSSQPCPQSIVAQITSAWPSPG